ncbi:MAG TPA: NADH-quinone oxidoreductase subunit N [Acidobacteriaceae bacterium]|jgi:NADH-quinone oxidoreductase subunit N|nr:NADH-quinone oxidoreductase subunit N [Acidobacteriaceae bacterium]
MNSSLYILPEILLTIFGILVMLADATMPRGASRKPLGWIAVLGALGALAASSWQYQLPAGTAYFGVVRIDAFSIFFHILIAGIVLASLLTTLDAVRPETEGLGELFALMLFGAVGMMLMTSAVELLLVFIGLEISSISTYIMAGFRRKSAKSPESAIKYFLLGSFATAFFLYGIALVFGATGTTRIADIAAALAGSTAANVPPLIYVGLAMIVIGLGFKVSAAPFHVWTPDVYEGAPSPVVGLMSTAPKAAAFAVLLRITFEALPSLHVHWVPVLWWLAVISMTLGNLGALRQRNVKRMLAYSSIAHAGYLLVAFTALSAEGVAAASFYAVTYAAMNVGVFAIVSHAGGYDDRLTLVDDYRGLAYRSPLLAGAMAFFLISLIGIPFTGGFFGKFYVFTAALHAGMIWLTIIGLINSGIAAFYYLRVALALFARPAEAAPVMAVERPSLPLLLSVFLTAAATLILGIVPGNVLGAARAAAQTLTVSHQQSAPEAAGAATDLSLR